MTAEAITNHIKRRLERSPNPERVAITLTRQAWDTILLWSEAQPIITEALRGAVLAYREESQSPAHGEGG